MINSIEDIESIFIRMDVEYYREEEKLVTQENYDGLHIVTYNKNNKYNKIEIDGRPFGNDFFEDWIRIQKQIISEY